MDYETLIKDESILQLIEHFQSRFGKHVFRIKDHWPADLYAIGLVDQANRYLLYVSTYGQKDNSYNVILETKAADGALAFRAEQNFENLSLQELEHLFAQRFVAKVIP
jgi:hypothetical protein